MQWLRPRFREFVNSEAIAPDLEVLRTRIDLALPLSSISFSLFSISVLEQYPWNLEIDVK